MGQVAILLSGVVFFPKILQYRVEVRFTNMFFFCNIKIVFPNFFMWFFWSGGTKWACPCFLRPEPMDAE